VIRHDAVETNFFGFDIDRCTIEGNLLKLLKRFIFDVYRIQARDREDNHSKVFENSRMRFEETMIAFAIIKSIIELEATSSRDKSQIINR